MKGVLCIVTMVLACIAPAAQTGEGGKPLMTDEKALLEIDHAWGRQNRSKLPLQLPPPAHEMQRKNQANG